MREATDEEPAGKGRRVSSPPREGRSLHHSESLGRRNRPLAGAPGFRGVGNHGRRLCVLPRAAGRHAGSGSDDAPRRGDRSGHRAAAERGPRERIRGRSRGDRGDDPDGSGPRARRRIDRGLFDPAETTGSTSRRSRRSESRRLRKRPRPSHSRSRSRRGARTTWPAGRTSTTRSNAFGRIRKRERTFSTHPGSRPGTRSPRS